MGWRICVRATQCSHRRLGLPYRMLGWNVQGRRLKCLPSVNNSQYLLGGPYSLYFQRWKHAVHKPCPSCFLSLVLHPLHWLNFLDHPSNLWWSLLWSEWVNSWRFSSLLSRVSWFLWWTCSDRNKARPRCFSIRWRCSKRQPLPPGPTFICRYGNVGVEKWMRVLPRGKWSNAPTGKAFIRLPQSLLPWPGTNLV